MSDEREKTERGFRVYGRSDDKRVKVVESSTSFIGPHVRIFAGEEGVHLSLPDAKLVLVALSAFAREAEAGMLTERVPENAPQLYGVVLGDDDISLIAYAMGVYTIAASNQEEELDATTLAKLERCNALLQRLSLARGGR